MEGRGFPRAGMAGPRDFPALLYFVLLSHFISHFISHFLSPIPFYPIS